MGWSVPHVSKKGRTTYRAYFRDMRGETVYEGTYATEKESDKAWQAAEARIADGRIVDAKGGRVKFKDYVLETWFPNHVIEQSSADDYEYRIRKYLNPWFGHLPMNQIYPADVREWVTWMRKDQEVSPANLKKTMSPLSAIFKTALNDGLIYLHPCKGIKLPTVPETEKEILTVEEFDAVFVEIADFEMQMLLETDIETGFRWGELTELRAKDWHSTERTFKVSRAVIKVRPSRDPDGYSFRVKPYPKGKKPLEVKVSEPFAKKVDRYLEITGKSGDDLLFTYEAPEIPSQSLPPEDLGLTPPNAAGRQYRHGTTTAYQLAKCRCDHCRGAYAAYRASRRAVGLDTHDSKQPAKKALNPEGHVPGWWFRRRIWHPALEAVGIKSRIRVHDLRATHISWLLAGGADLESVRDRVGHKSIVTTAKYVRKLKGNDDKTLSALEKIRNGTAQLPQQRQPSSPAQVSPLDNMSMDDLVKEMGRIQAEMARKARS
ncbi:tyrosine-type recombinase/integrase [Glycomyces sp. NPDC047010]|uniref:tyrosine-type recombinase/integrase n=1 Tax=Glycomyces sp. NPDC047010 TaxID=3155023 RepID=UPI0033C392C0